MICEYYHHTILMKSVNISEKDVHALIEKSHLNAMKCFYNAKSSHILYAIVLYNENEQMERLMVFHQTYVNDEELEFFVKKYPNGRFFAIHENGKNGCRIVTRKKKSREIRPITLKEANTYVNAYHRHNTGTVGCKFAIGLYEGEQLIGVAICGRPVSRYLDDGTICEINRLCTRGDVNACSMLYGACSRIARDMGYKKIITYTLASESGITLKASNFICEGRAGGTHWTGKRNRQQNLPAEMKTRWMKIL